MILLDSDHVSLLPFEQSARRSNLLARLSSVHNETIGTTIITVEEQMRGWMASIAKEKTAARLVFSYDRLLALFGFFATFTVVRFDPTAAEQFEQLRKRKIRIGTMDLKVASIALAQNALLLSANRKDFEQVPGLRCENWLD
jgi:tRNA(fMet)-specific endonuclease VapC